MSHVLLSPELMSKPLDNPELVGPAIRAFAAVASAWCLTDSERTSILEQPMHVLLTVLPKEDQGDLRAQTMERVSYVLGIYRALHTIFPDQEQADGWLRRPNASALIKGRPALVLMCSGRLEDLASVRAHLDALGLDES